MAVKSIAQIVLKLAARTVIARGPHYGPPHKGLSTVARLWSVILGCRVESWQVALCLQAVKTARILVTPGHLDSWVDSAGYAAIGAECAPLDVPDPNPHNIPPQPKVSA